MAKRGIRIAIWQLDKKLTLETVLELLRRDYKSQLDFLKGFDIDDHDRTLQNEWVSTRPGRPLEIQSLTISSRRINYISAVGQYENYYGEKKAVVEGQPLPRSSRVFNQAVRVVFFNLHERIYCALEIGESQESKLRSALFGQTRGNKMEEWGTINFRKKPPFIFDSRFFYWIFSKKGKVFNITEDTQTLDEPMIESETGEKLEVKLIDVSAVSQLSDRNVYDSRSEGTNVLGSLPALSGLGTNQSVYEGGFCFSFPFNTIFMNILSDGNCIIDYERSTFFFESGEEADFDQVFDRVVLFIYNILFPSILEIYHTEINDGTWSISLEEEQRKNWSLRVVRDLCEENNITLEDLEDFFQ